MRASRHILIASDAWRPQVNGVVRTLETTIQLLREQGHTVEIIHPYEFPGFPCPFYREIRLCFPDRGPLVRRAKALAPDHVHIATEGPIGLAVRALCRRLHWRHTSSYHTKFPEYLRRLVYVPESWTYRYMRWFHRPSARVMTATPSLDRELRERGFANELRRWSRGVDLTLFHPRKHRTLDYPRPIQLYVGRVSSEKEIDKFLRVKTPGTKVIVGDGPARESLEEQFPEAVFLGYRRGEELGQIYSSADVFVFPSQTDTFGLVMIEAMASGVPVAGHPVPGPIDVVIEEGIGALDDDLAAAIQRALKEGNPTKCIEYAAQFTWENATKQFLGNLVEVLGD